MFESINAVFCFLSPYFDATVIIALVVYLMDPINWSVLRGFRPTAIAFVASFDAEKDEPCVLLIQRKDGLGGEWVFAQTSCTNEDSNVVAKDLMAEHFRLDKRHFALKKEVALGELKLDGRSNLRGIWRWGFSLFRRMRGKSYIGFVINVEDTAPVSCGLEVAHTQWVTFAEAKKLLKKSVERNYLSPKKHAIFKGGLIELEKYKNYYLRKKAETQELFTSGREGGNG